MTREVLALAGQIIGAYLGAQYGPLGQAVGAAIGGYAGSNVGPSLIAPPEDVGQHVAERTPRDGPTP